MASSRRSRYYSGSARAFEICMRVSYVPVLKTLRELYVQPRDMRRFRQYIATLTGGSDDVVVPIGLANPMAREHAVAKIDELLALGAEDSGARAAAGAGTELAAVASSVEIKASVVLADDVAGGWTNRYTTEASARFPGRGALKRPFATALVWTSESPTISQIDQEVRAAIYRVAYQQRRGLPTALAAMLEQEGLAGVFAGLQTLTGRRVSGARASHHCRARRRATLSHHLRRHVRRPRRRGPRLSRARPAAPSRLRSCPRRSPQDAARSRRIPLAALPRRSSGSGEPAAPLFTSSGSGEPAAPRGPSLLRSFLAARSLSPRPPAQRSCWPHSAGLYPADIQTL